MVTVLLVILILIAIGALPNWSHSRTWGYGPSGIAGLILVILIILLLVGVLERPLWLGGRPLVP
jgi:uncharacterized protein DUF3309